MPDIEISEDQRAFLDELAAELTDEHVGEYGAVRYRDALQFLIDRYRGTRGGQVGGETAPEAAGDPDGADESPPDDEGRLEAMMNLLDTHDDKWEEAGGEDGNYTVTLPDGGSETARTQDDVRALLFKHYG